ncbi:MAG: hypothetical protein AAGF75_06475 [Cyanobacteria bacterium P01_H01_bin.130]
MTYPQSDAPSKTQPNAQRIAPLAQTATPQSLSDAAELLMVPDSISDRIVLLDANDGSLVDGNFIDGGDLFSTPFNAIQVENEIWVSDQVADSIFRYDLTGKFLGAIADGLDNVRGMEYVNGVVYVSNLGTVPGTSEQHEEVAMFDPQGNHLGCFRVGRAFDILFFKGELLINDIRRHQDGGENIDRYDLEGNFLGVFHDADHLTGIDFPQQMARRANGNLLVAGFSDPGGIYEYDAEGNQINLYDIDDGFAKRVRGVYELGNGNILWTSGDGVLSTNLETRETTDMYTVNTLDFRPATRYIEPLCVSR